jgi:hypothetical protein
MFPSPHSFVKVTSLGYVTQLYLKLDCLPLYIIDINTRYSLMLCCSLRVPARLSWLSLLYRPFSSFPTHVGVSVMPPRQNHNDGPDTSLLLSPTRVGGGIGNNRRQPSYESIGCMVRFSCDCQL